MGEEYAELWVRIEKSFQMKEDVILAKWQQLIHTYQKEGFDVNDDTQSIGGFKAFQDEICVGLGSGAKTSEPDYDAMYELFGKFVQFLYEKILYNGTLNMSLERTGASG